MRSSARRRMWRGSPSYGSPSGVRMSANMRATPPAPSSGRQGRTAKVDGSGMAIMSDSSMALKPVIEEPSKPIPPSKASSSCAELIENDFSRPRTSVNHRRMKRIPRSSTRALTSSGVCGRSAIWGGIRGRLEQPAVAPRLEFGEGVAEIPPALGQLVLDLHGRAVADPALDDPTRLELLQALGEQAIRQVGNGVGDLAEAHRTGLEQDVDDGPAPALAHELDGLVQAGAAVGTV